MKYYYIIDGTTYGPETKKQIDERKLAGQIPLDVQLIEADGQSSDSNKIENTILISIAIPVLLLTGVSMAYSGPFGSGVWEAVFWLGSILFFMVIFWWLCGKIAHAKGLEPLSYKVLGALLGIIGLAVVLAIPKRN